MDHVLNWIWQGTAVACATEILLRILARSRAGDRFVLCGVALLAVLVLPFVSLARRAQPAGGGPAGGSEAGHLLALPDVWWTGDAALLAACVAWSAVQTVRLLQALAALRQLRASCHPVQPLVESRLRHWNRVRRSGRHARLVVSSRIPAAVVLGGGTPLIAVAPALLRRLPLEDLDRVIVHEWAHVQRYDDVLNLAQMAVRTMAGWHPAVWWLDRQLHIEREAACDEAAIAVSGSGKGYATSLTRLASLAQVDRRAAVLGVLAPKLETRVVRILSHDRLAGPRRSAGRAATAGASLCAASFAMAGLPIVGMADAIASGIEPVFVRTNPAPPLRPEPSPAASDGAARAVEPVLLVPVDDGRIARPPRRTMPVTGARADEGAGPSGTRPARSRQLLDGRALPLDAAAVPATVADRSGMPADPAMAAGGDRTAAAEAQSGARSDEGPAAWSPWPTAAAAGSAVGKGARQAATGTAGFFTRFGKKIAASF